jgi:hypothetical protein
MQNAFRSGMDIHTTTASQVFGVAMEDVTPLQRRHAKAVNFGIVYGISEFSLADDIGVSFYEAKEYINNYLSNYRGVKTYMKQVVEDARKIGYTTTLYGRRRYIPELTSSNFNIRQGAERIALNTPIQGTAADLIKLAMIRVDEALREKYPQAKLILQVHDELIVECPEELASQVSESIEKYFFVNGHCSDCLHCSTGVSAEKAVADDHKRSNQLLLITLRAVKDPEKVHRILDDAAELLVPGGIRTLADEQVSFALPVYHHGRLLNDPVHPYRGKYCGPEDTERKVAYHNGTVWCWPFPAYCEALFIAGGSSVRKRALTLLMSVVKYFEYGAAGQLPEVADGDAPHTPGGCPAQAWSLSEFYRVYGLLKIQNS